MLLGRSASDDFEKEVLRVLSECKPLPNLDESVLMLMLMQRITAYDAAFGDLTQMFNDLAVSKDLGDDYRNVKRGKPERPDAALSVMVLQHSVWPVIRKVVKTETGVEIVLPSKVRISQRYEMLKFTSI
jgi:Cullin family